MKVRLMVGERKARKHFNLMHRNIADDGSREKIIGRYRKTRVPCSCFMCGNPRKKFGNGKESKTIRDKKQEITVMEEKDEIDNGS